jgi:DNA-binding NarL/FixJ family response regulator
MIRVFVAAPSPLGRAGLEALLRISTNLEIVGSASDWTRLAGADPDVIVAVWDRPGDEAPADLLEVPPGVSLILLADDPRHAWTAEAMRSGVRAVLPRESSAQQILAAVEAAAAGLAVLPAEDIEALLAAPRPTKRIEALSPREVEVLGMMAEGFSNKEIAYRLGISEHTVKFHVTSVMAKLNAGSRTEAVTLGLRQGLILL